MRSVTGVKCYFYGHNLPICQYLALRFRKSWKLLYKLETIMPKKYYTTKQSNTSSGRWGWGHLTKFYTKRLRPKVQNFTILNANFDRKRSSFIHRKFYENFRLSNP